MFRLCVLLFAFLCLCVAGKKPTIILQLSDLHFSTNKHGKYFKHFGDREKDLHTFSTDILPALSPSSILITGDLTDAKNPQDAGLQQELEWIAYRQAIDHIVQSTDIPEILIFDVKGNHDAFNLPLRGGDWDYWPSYAVEGRRSGPTKRVFVNQIFPPSSPDNSNNEEDGGGPPPCPSVTLLGIDASAQVGLKSPANFCGHITPDILRDIDHELTKLDDKRHSYCVKPPLIVYSHFPISTLDHRPADTYSSTGRHINTTNDVHARYSRGGVVGAIRHLTHKITPMQGLGELLASHQATVYVSGHLHTVFGERLHTVHTHKGGHNINNNNNMVELETAAWKDDRRFRLMSIDTDDDDATTSSQQSGFTFMDLYFHTPLSPRQEKRGDGEATKDGLWRSRYKVRGWAVTSTDTSARVIDHIPMITWPPDGRYQVVEKKMPAGEVGRGTVNAMVFPLVRKKKMMTENNATTTLDDNDDDGDLLLSIEKVTLVTRLSSGVKLLEHDMQLVDGDSMYYTAAPEITIYCPKGANNNNNGGGGGGGLSSSHYHAPGSGSGNGEDERACSDGVKHIEIQVIVKYKDTNGGKHNKGVMLMESRSIVQPALLKCSSDWNGEGKRAVSETCRITPATELLPLGTSIIEKIFLNLSAPVFTQQVIVVVWLIQVVALLLLPRMLLVKYVPQLLTAPLFAPTELKKHAIAAGYFGTVTMRAWRACLGTLLWPFVALCITASVSEVWLPWFLYSIYLIAGPWLMADLLSGRPPALMFWYGVAGKFSDGVNVGLGQAAPLNWQYIATPDTMLLSLAHFIGCVVPVTLWIACVVARRVQLSTSPAPARRAASSASVGNSMTSPGRNNNSNNSTTGKPQGGGGGSLLVQEGPKYKLFSTLQLLFFAAMLMGNVGVIYIKAAHLMGPLCLIVSPGLTGTIVLAVVLVRWKKFGAIVKKKGKTVLTSSAGGKR